jgi:uncharacterized protein (DUF1501 family)
MANNDLNRRQFLRASAGTVAGTGILLSGIAPRFSAPQAATASALNIPIKKQKKALVFVMLDGGNDSFNMLVPSDPAHFSEYQKTRANLALAKNALLPLKNTRDSQGRTFGLHPSLKPLQKLYNTKKLSFVANIGPMIAPLTKASFMSNAARIPLGLLSHADQFKHWQTARPDQRVNQGWFGHIADNIQVQRKDQQIPMNISLSGSNTLQNGIKSSHYSITDEGSVGLVINERKSALNKEIFNSFNQLLASDYPDDPFKQTYIAQTREAQSLHQVFRDATEHVKVPTAFSDSDLSQQLRKIAQSIKAADALGLDQQTYFVRYIGWDHHDELLDNHARMLKVLANGLSEFQHALQKMQLDDQVITFTGSDFGRTLTSNGNGTDHGWGGNSIVMGSPISGGQVLGEYPSLGLANKNPLDIGNGVLIPTLPIDALYAELAKWFGVPNSHIDQLFPNLANFAHHSCKNGIGLFNRTNNC